MKSVTSDVELSSFKVDLYHPNIQSSINGRSEPSKIWSGPLTIVENEGRVYWKMGEFGYLHPTRQGDIALPNPVNKPLLRKELSKEAVELMIYDSLRIKSRYTQVRDEELREHGLGPNRKTVEDICQRLGL